MAPSTLAQRRPLVPGVYVPVITIFKDDEAQSLDIDAYQKHILFMAKAGIHGFVCQGTTAEGPALTFEERAELVKATRSVLDKNGFAQVPIIVGVAGGSTQETVKLAVQANEAGGDYVISLPPSYFAGNMTMAALEAFYTELADKSPLPVLIYSFPAVSSGLELPSESIHRLARHENIVGIKQTDHNVGKMSRIAYQNPGFAVFAGASDYFLGALAVGVHGAITGIGNVFPKLVIDFYNQCLTVFGPNPSSGASLAEAIRKLQVYQGQLSVAETVIISGGIPSTKYACQHYLGWGGPPRRPVPESPKEVKARVEEGLKELAELESKLL
ncbi:hypothetical protein M407DRAFT_24092 [Tulasnella calospora MUT 4182]|uniref:Uncharacterized protein n=1 Tax=Tulasnella calospora MUT 4182 TaxID=1051891 RepID=A0A0C3KZ35_9AGAM|nr:hypothetical protein M407DRAFT_24092 [Tulasnella calospora MUT 4182]